MYLGMDTPISFVFYNHFNILLKECLFSLTLSLISSSSHKLSHHHLCFQSNLRSTLRISHLVVFSHLSLSCSSPLSNTDLGSADPLILPIIINNLLSSSL